MAKVCREHFSFRFAFAPTSGVCLVAARRNANHVIRTVDCMRRFGKTLGFREHALPTSKSTSAMRNANVD
eukprot:549641-Amphidinium_carterae.1